MTKSIKLTLACTDYDRTRALRDGRVTPHGIDLTYLSLPIEEIFSRMLSCGAFDVAEMSLSAYVMTLTLKAEMTSLVAIPVFPSKAFRQSFIFVNKNAGIDCPSDLVGKRVGMAQYRMTSAVWQRGILEDEYGVPLRSIDYFTGAVEQDNSLVIEEVAPSNDIRMTPIPCGATISGMLASGELDAIYGAAIPSCYHEQGQNIVTRLFPNHFEVEKDFLSRNKYIPIMHLIVIRRDIYDRNPWVAQELTMAFENAKRLAYQDLEHSGEFRVMLPWLVAHLEETRTLFGEKDFWKYGIEANYSALKQFLLHSHRQGLAKGRFTPEQLFARETLSQ